MTKKSKKNSKGDTFEWEETEEVREALKKLHEDIRIRKLKAEDDKLNYDTGGK
tara:strand:+ start:31 stop:189 length:159 start_codon:yes stop_codon:yes gene_type:complete